MRICIIHQYYLQANDAGISRFNQFARYWADAGHEITVVCGTVHYMTGYAPHRYDHTSITTEKETDRITIVRCHVSPEYNKNFLGRMRGYLSFMFFSSVAVFRLARHDVVIATSPPLFVGIPGVIAAWKWRAPFVFEVRDIWPDSAIELGVLTNRLLIVASRLIERFLYQAANIITTLGPGYREALISKKGVSEKKIFIVPNGADIDLLVPTKNIQSLRSEFGWTEKIVVTYIGAHGIANHLEHILDTAALLKESHQNIVFVCIGSGMQRDKLIALANERKLSNVQFIEPQPKREIANFIYASDICLAVLKKADVFKTVYPNKIFDYMVCGRPIIVAIDGAARDLVEKAGAGIFAEPENPVALRSAILELSEDAVSRQEMGSKGAAYVRMHFSRQAIATQYLLYLQALV